VSSITKSVEVEVPVQAAYDQWTQFEDFPRFMEGVEEVVQVDDRHLRWNVRVAGAERTFDAEITEQHPDERVAWKATGETMHAGVVTFHRLDDGKTKVTLQMDLEPSDWVERVGDALGIVDARIQGDLDRFKEFIEERHVPTGAWRGEIDRPR
jgi:uncharacterized membrane protein